ncbi:hypothetical protein UA08_01842 [Talaromyces atroroseus]|uniref:AB hydrolase-1 domain-containing protein n=1 Tax=Talaromyces atroroseus TaxID=1441469 RepID=A0A1Q5QBD9_TALAT|nr:hypothetical protein UA08_01842 [Talaromyces atroroseus]OKL63244.1 hypothetical protein UA08_01842 [Talaromyces atroroseus]
MAPIFVLVPGASQSPAAYGYLLHILQTKGYGAFTALLPSVGATGPVTVQDDTDYVRNRLLLPILDVEKHDVILISHSYSGIPASAAARGLGKTDRVAEGKTTSVLGQIFIAAVVTPGGDGKDLVANFGGHLPPHIRPDEEANLLKCDDPRPPLFNDLPSELADASAMSSMSQGMTSFTSPCPAASWNTEAFKGRIAYIKTVNDAAVPYQAQSMMLQASGQEWITRDIETGHSAQLAAPEKLAEMLLEIAKQFEAL